MKLSDLKKDLSNKNTSPSDTPKKPLNPIGSMGNAVGNMVASTSTLSSNQEKKVEKLREDVQALTPDPMDEQSKELTMDRLAHLGVEIFNAHLPVLESLYVPLNENQEFEKDGGFQPGYNIRWFQLNRWVTEKEENSLDKLVNVYESLANENCNIALVFRRTCQKTEVYLGVVNLDNKSSKTYANALHKRLNGSLKGNFPGAVWQTGAHEGELNFLDRTDYSVACVSNLPGEKSEKFQTQTIEKLLDGVVPETAQDEYTLILIASPIQDLEERKLKLAEYYSTLHPYSQWDTNYTGTESTAIGSSSTANVYGGTSQSRSAGLSSGASTGMAGPSLNVGVNSSVSRGVNFGASFARSSSQTETIGKSKGVTQRYINYPIKHALDHLEEQVKRMDQATALGMWDFAAYVVGEDYNTVTNVAHTYLALTQGDSSFLSQSAVNVWRGDIAERSQRAKEIVAYLRQLRHPKFDLDQEKAIEDPSWRCYPSGVRGTTALTSKELAWALNFPKKSVTGFPVSEYTAFGRNIVWHNEPIHSDRTLDLGHVWHLNQEENEPVKLDLESLSSHTFIAGSTGSGKTNTIVQMLDGLVKQNIHFLVIEPAKGEYKDVFGSNGTAKVYGTNPKKGPVLRINPFSFPEDIHVLEHIDRLVEIFNVCWPMYAAMPAVLKDAIIQSYEQCGWDLVMSENEYDDTLYPTFEDVAANVRLIINSSEYDAENKGAYKGALLTRLNSLTNGLYSMIFTADELSNEELFDENVIADLSRIGSQESKSLLMGLLFLKLQEYRMAEKEGMNLPLQHVTILEEAHHLLKKTEGSVNAETGSLQAKSVEMLANAIAEMRTCGEGFIIADQAPGLLDRSVIRNTNTKILMKMPELEDREISGKSANLTTDQLDELGKLPTGVAAVYQNGWIEPVLCKIYKADAEAVPYKAESNIKPKKHRHKQNMDRICIADMIFRDGLYNPEQLKEECGDLLSSQLLSGKARAELYEIMSKPVEKRTVKDASTIISDLFSGIKTTIQSGWLNNTALVSELNNANQQLLNTYPDLQEEIRDRIIRCILWQVATEQNQLALYDHVCAEWKNEIRKLA